MAVVLMTSSGKKFFVSDTSKDYHCQYGFVKAENLKPGDVKTNTGKKMTVMPATFKDIYGEIKRSAQIIPRKDIGAIITETGIGRDTCVLDAGAGSGGLCCFLAHIAKKVVTYDIREDFLNIVEKNKKMMDLSNLEIRKENIYEAEVNEKFDVMTLDVPEPWKALGTAKRSLRRGGFLVSYSPSIPQVMDFVRGLRDDFIHLSTIEVIQRSWDVRKRIVRPKTQKIGHSGFLTFSRVR